MKSEQQKILHRALAAPIPRAIREGDWMVAYTFKEHARVVVKALEGRAPVYRGLEAARQMEAMR